MDRPNKENDAENNLNNIANIISNFPNTIWCSNCYLDQPVPISSLVFIEFFNKCIACKRLLRPNDPSTSNAVPVGEPYPCASTDGDIEVNQVEERPICVIDKVWGGAEELPPLEPVKIVIPKSKVQKSPNLTVAPAKASTSRSLSVTITDDDDVDFVPPLKMKRLGEAPPERNFDNPIKVEVTLTDQEFSIVDIYPIRIVDPMLTSTLVSEPEPANNETIPLEEICVNFRESPVMSRRRLMEEFADYSDDSMSMSPPEVLHFDVSHHDCLEIPAFDDARDVDVRPIMLKAEIKEEIIVITDDEGTEESPEVPVIQEVKNEEAPIKEDGKEKPIEKQNEESPKEVIEVANEEAPKEPMDAPKDEAQGEGPPQQPIEKMTEEPPIELVEKMTEEAPIEPIAKITEEVQIQPVEKMTEEAPIQPVENMTEEAPIEPVENMTEEALGELIQKILEEAPQVPIEEIQIEDNVSLTAFALNESVEILAVEPFEFPREGAPQEPAESDKEPAQEAAKGSPDEEEPDKVVENPKVHLSVDMIESDI